MEPIMKIKPISLNFGAEISGIDVRTITNDEFSRLYSAWLTYGVVRIRGQHINEEELQAFTTLEQESTSAGDQLLEILLKPYQNTNIDQSRQDAIISMESTLAALRSDELKEKVATDMSMSIDALTELIQKAQAQGEVDPQFSPSALSALLHGTASGLASLRPLLSEDSTYIVAAQDLLIALVESLYSPSLARRSQDKKSTPLTPE